MDNTQQFMLPDVGEGLVEAEIVRWHVKVGQTVAINDPLVDIETAKSVVELPSPWAGVVHELLADEGSVVEVGTPIVAVVAAADVAGGGPPRSTTGSSPVVPVDEEDAPQVLVGPGPKTAVARTRRLSASGAPAGRPSTTIATSVRPAALPQTDSPASPRSSVLCKPPVRLLAKQLGVDLAALAHTVTGPITRADIQRAAEDAGRAGVGTRPAASSETPFLPTQATGSPTDGRETRVPVKGVRKATARAMTQSAFSAPHVTEWLTVDMTPTMQLVRRLKVDARWSGVRVNPLLFVARAFIMAVRNFPDINATWDEDAQEIVLKDYVNLGVAAATPRGLLVPNIKDAHLMDLRQLAGALEDLVVTARAGKTQPAQMANGTVTLTNIGALGVDAGTPILNPGESAILAFGQVRKQPWVVDDQIEIREVTQLAMSFDHRLVDGELGSRVLARTGEVLADPSAALLYG